MEYKTERKGISKMKNIISEKMKIESVKHVTKKTGLTTMKDPEFFLCSVIPAYWSGGEGNSKNR